MGWHTSQDELDQIEQTLRGMLDAPGNVSEVGLRTPSSQTARLATGERETRVCLGRTQQSACCHSRAYGFT